VGDTPAPTSKDECKQGGWATFNNPSFRNQGDCVSSVARS
jgi:glucuronoarabinoxylan endo-1,4-beta-xylanase